MVKVVIIGAGIAGLSAARLLSKAGVDVTVLEARGRVGGRTYTVEEDSFGSVDLGGTYIGTGQRRIYRLCKELGIKFYKIELHGKIITDVQGRRMIYEGLIPPLYNPIIVLDLNNVIRTIDKIAAQIPLDSPWKAPNAKQLDSKTLLQFIDEVCWTKYCKETVIIMMRALLGAEPHEVSVLSLLWMVHSSMLLSNTLGVGEGAQQYKVEGGAQIISDKMAEELGQDLKLSEPVTRVEETSNKLKVTTSAGKIYEADYVLSAMPLTLLNRVEFVPSLPSIKFQAIQRLPLGSVIKTFLFYKTAFWREKGLCGESFSDYGPVHFSIEDTNPKSSYPSLMSIFEGDKAREMSLLSAEERKSKLTSHFADLFKCDDFLSPIHYMEQDWMSEEYSGGCYGSNFPTGVITQYMEHLSTPHGRVHFAGTETSTQWVGYMDGAIESGERAAKEILFKLGKVSEHEIKAKEPESPDFPDSLTEPMWIEKVLPSVGSFLLVTSAVTASFTAWIVNKYFSIF